MPRTSAPDASPTLPDTTPDACSEAVRSAADASAPLASAPASVGGAAPVVLPLEDLLRRLPPSTMFPAEWVLERLVAERTAGEARRRADAVARDCAVAPAAPALLTTKEFGALHVPRRTAEWVADRCREGSIEGAEQDSGGAWRIPRAALAVPVLRPGRARGPAATPAAPATTANLAATGPRDVVRGARRTAKNWEPW